MFQLCSFAKINLGLEIVGKRADGYHNLITIFQTIDWCDEIAIEITDTPAIQLSGSDPAIDWGESNTIMKMCRLVYSRYAIARGLNIHVTKNIPSGAGLGGGSSNAAVVLLFLNDYFQLRLPLPDLIALAAAIGADVPFFLLGGTVLAEGIGDQLTPLADLPTESIALMVPTRHVSTRLIFSKLILTTNGFTSKIKTFLQTRDFSELENNLENTTFQLFPEIGEIKKRMLDKGLKSVQMSGSGSAVYAIVADQDCAVLQKDFPAIKIVRTVQRSDYHARNGAWPSGKASVFGTETRRFESFRPSILNPKP